MPRRGPTPAELLVQLARLYRALGDLHDLRVQPGLKDFRHREVVLCRAIRWAEVELEWATEGK